MFLLLSLWYLLTILMFELFILTFLFGYSTSSCTIKQLNIISNKFPCGIAVSDFQYYVKFCFNPEIFCDKTFSIGSFFLTDRWIKFPFYTFWCRMTIHTKLKVAFPLLHHVLKTENSSLAKQTIPSLNSTLKSLKEHLLPFKFLVSNLNIIM